MGWTTRAIGAAFVLALGACASFDAAPTRSEAGLVINAGVLGADELRLGDCFNDPGSAVDSVDVVPCDELHHFELYHWFDLDDGAYPGVDAMEDLWIQGCLVEFESFVGAPFDESQFDISAIFPTEQTWDDLSDREVMCSVTALGELGSTGSARNSGI